MDKMLILAFVDELEKISSAASEMANSLVDLPIKAVRYKRDPMKSHMSAEARLYAKTDEYPIDGMSTADVHTGYTQSPSVGPGGV